MYKTFVRPLLFRIGSDKVHEATIDWASRASESNTLKKLARLAWDYQAPSLHQELLGLKFRNPVGLAAGFDKNGTFPGLMEAMGFGFVEIGSVTADPAPGNPKPRTFRLPEDQSLINRMGLNNDGAATVVRRLQKLDLNIPIGINIAKTNDPTITGERALDDYRESFDLAREVADYITLNISCPNTSEGKTFEEPEAFSSLLERLEISRDLALPPVFVKFSVDLERPVLLELLDIARSNSVSGYVAVNTSTSREGLRTPKDVLDEIGAGGLSGRAIAGRSTRLIELIHEVTRGEKPIIGVGGIFSAEDALEKIRAGADLVQVYSGLVYEGPGLVREINKGIRNYLRRNDLTSIYQIRSGSRKHSAAGTSEDLGEVGVGSRMRTS